MEEELVGKNYLVTTSDLSTWPEEEYKIIFLGEWCKPFSKTKELSKLNSTTLKYHWDDRNKLHKDYLYIQSFSSKILNSLVAKLNQIHGVNYGINYWNLIVGFWVVNFIEMIFDRWESISILDQKECFSIIHSLDYDELIPPDSKSFADKMKFSDRYNSIIYALIMNFKGNFKLINKKKGKEFKFWYKGDTNGFKNLYEKFLKKIYSLVFTYLSNDNSSVILNSYLSLIDQFALAIKLNTLPILGYSKQTSNFKPDPNFRNWKLDISCDSDFEEFISNQIPKMMPMIYLEGFKKVSNNFSGYKFPNSPKFIFNSVETYYDDHFKIYAANCKKNESKILTYQHGGNYGTSKFDSIGDYQLSISDIFFSWGWSSNNSKVIPLGYLNKMSKLKINNRKNTEILIVTCSLPRYSNYIYSHPLSSLWLDYFEEQTQFVKNLNESARRNLKIRIYQHDYEREQISRWNNNFSNLKIDNGLKQMRSLISKTAIFISTYHGTTFYESIYLNIPTIIFWKPNHWELNEISKEMFNKLKHIKVFHESPVSAARHLNDIVNEPLEWWNKTEVKLVIKEFKNKYCKKTDINQMIKEIKEIK